MAYEQEASRHSQDDDQMVEIPPDEDEDLEAVLASYETQQLSSLAYVSSPIQSDDEYDDLFAELIAKEVATDQGPHQPQACPYTQLSHPDWIGEDSNMLM